MKNSQYKICDICHGKFEPDYRVGDRQRVCSKLSCQQERKRRAQHAWLTKNPGYFKGRYPELKEKILDRQQQLNTEKAKELSVTPTPSVTIQDEITIHNNNILTMLLKIVTIQDEITPKFIIVNQQLRQLKAVLYKTSEQSVFNKVNGSYYTRRDCISPFN
jgi:hypothetical protein